MPQRDSWCPIHLAIDEGHVEVVELLIDLGVNVEKPLNSNCDRLTPLMLASATGNLDIVKLLTTKGKAKIEKMDKYKKTALTHSIINGNANVASYLVSKGAAFDKPDSSMNTNLHYACAYGWYFCAKLLIDAGASPNAANEWKLTPVAVAFLKGHSGLAKWLLDIPGRVGLQKLAEKGLACNKNVASNPLKISSQSGKPFTLGVRHWLISLVF